MVPFLRPVPLLAALLLAGCLPNPPPPDARRDYADYCAACHGAGGRGDGPLAADLVVPPADLTRLAAGNGGVFPAARVMSEIDGYLRVRHGGRGPMPEFGALLEGPVAAFDDGSGRPVPVPARLLGLARHIERLQR